MGSAMKHMRKYICQILLLSLQALSTGFGQSPDPGSASSEQSGDNGRTICEKFNENMTAPELVVCPSGYRHCFTRGYLSQRGTLYILFKGCWLPSKSEEGECYIDSCLFGLRPSVRPGTKRTCCCRGYSCNKNSTHVDRYLVIEKPTTTRRTTRSELPARRRKTNRVEDISPKETVILGVISSVFATFLILSIVFVSWRCAARKNKLLVSSKALPVEKAVEDTVEFSIMSTENVSFASLIHKGKFANIWNAGIDGRQVAIKIFKSESHSKWRNEKKTYDILGFHPNIAEFISGVELSGPFKSGKAIILTYYPYGSLLQFLITNVLSWRTMYNLVFSLASGVAYIHGEIDEYDHFRRKLIVHLDLKSSSVLVKNDATCALCDFASAVRVTGKQILPMPEGGSINYMPPEVLRNEVNWNDWESSLKQTDLYSAGLIFWEIVRRCQDFYRDNEQVSNACLPYESELGENPSTAEMIAHVSKERKRPLFPVAMGEADKSDSLLRNTIEECWDTEPEARLTALCVVKRMQEVRNMKRIAGDTDTITGSSLACSPSKTEFYSLINAKEESSFDAISLTNLPISEYGYQPTGDCCYSADDLVDAAANRKLLQDNGCYHSEERC